MSTLVKTEHPHIVRRSGVCGGEPLVDSLRVTVRHIVTLYKMGDSIQQIAETLNITEAQVYHALSYYADHQQEIDELIEKETDNI